VTDEGPQPDLTVERSREIRRQQLLQQVQKQDRVRDPYPLPDLVGAEDGWMSDVEVAVLVGYAKLLSPAMGPVLEIGCWKGRTTSGLATVGKVEVVDHFVGGKDMPPELRGRNVRPDFARNLERLDLLDRVTVHEGKTRDVLPQLESASYRLILVDASHEAEDVAFDVSEAWRLCSSGGFIFFDDINWESVQTAVVNFLRSKSLRALNLASQKLAFIKRP